MLKLLTQKYIEAFSNKDLELLAPMLNDEFVLEDPVVKRIEGKKNALEAIKNIFDSCENLSFKAINIFQSANETTMIEFELSLDDVELKGVDIIIWEDNKLKELRAYLDVPK